MKVEDAKGTVTLLYLQRTEGTRDHPRERESEKERERERKREKR
jgi:hypothetical protein